MRLFNYILSSSGKSGGPKIDLVCAQIFDPMEMRHSNSTNRRMNNTHHYIWNCIEKFPNPIVRTDFGAQSIALTFPQNLGQFSDVFVMYPNANIRWLYNDRCWAAAMKWQSMCRFIQRISKKKNKRNIISTSYTREQGKSMNRLVLDSVVN